ncbi:cytochrome P450 9e2-like [Aricia agestis]|uniref:cytochrome P450 9e2-like n=1 Tax=Aricia agestis TaxID=91739 RepID=UPI001C206A74|nr:cytochrome P450 9e2-like [Aricia agestis]
MVILYFLLQVFISFVIENWLTFGLLTIFLIFYINHITKINHFKNRDIKYIEPNILVGNLWPRLSCKKSYFETQLDIYNHFKGERYAGYFEGSKLVLYILDPDLLKAVMIKDFDYFVNRVAMPSNKRKQYLNRMILDLKNDEWKSVRTLVTPTFSSFRLKNMYPLMQNSSRKLLGYLEKIDCSEVEIKEVMGYYTLDVIGACAFGIDSCFNEETNTDFIKAAKNFNKKSSISNALVKIALLLPPALLQHLNISVFNSDALEVLLGILKQAKADRRSSKIERSDFLQLLIHAAEKEQEEKKGSIDLDDETIDAQALIFLLAGYETSSTLLSFAIHTLAVQPEIQQRLREHVRDVTGGEDVTYDHLGELDYLEGVLLETSRLYPPFPRIERVCVKPYTLPGTNVRIEVDEILAIPVVAVNTDPNLYPEPDKFIPERFTRETRMKRPSHHYLTFGAGPRNCIGYRFAMLSMKLAMCVLLRNYKFSLCSRTDNPLEIDKAVSYLKVKNGIWVRLDKIN